MIFLKKTIDINCDLGEGMGIEALIMPYISSANIACGYHAGDAELIKETIELCHAYGVAIGAHPSFDDRAGFGRTEIHLPDDELIRLVIRQIRIIQDAAHAAGTTLHHVKPHGALYNMAACDPHLAALICLAIKEVDTDLTLYGLSGSHMIHEAQKTGLHTMSEVFADRTYQDDGQLTPRSHPGALIMDVPVAVDQAVRMVRDGYVASVSGKPIPVEADTICIHGDGEHAFAFAKALHDKMKQEGISIQCTSVV